MPAALCRDRRHAVLGAPGLRPDHLAQGRRLAQPRPAPGTPPPPPPPPPIPYTHPSPLPPPRSTSRPSSPAYPHAQKPSRDRASRLPLRDLMPLRSWRRRGQGTLEHARRAVSCAPRCPSDEPGAPPVAEPSSALPSGAGRAAGGRGPAAVPRASTPAAGSRPGRSSGSGASLVCDLAPAHHAASPRCPPLPCGIGRDGNPGLSDAVGGADWPGSDVRELGRPSDREARRLRPGREPTGHDLRVFAGWHAVRPLTRFRAVARL